MWHAVHTGSAGFIVFRGRINIGTIVRRRGLPALVLAHHCVETQTETLQMRYRPPRHCPRIEVVLRVEPELRDLPVANSPLLLCVCYGRRKELEYRDSSRSTEVR